VTFVRAKGRSREEVGAHSSTGNVAAPDPLTRAMTLLTASGNRPGCLSDKAKWADHPPAPMYIRVPFNPVREPEWMIRALGIFKRNKIPIEERAHAISTRPAYRPGR
jgi:hypothetical protein